MANLCIPPSVNRKIKAALSKGELDVNDLIKNGSEYRVKKFEKIVGKDLAEHINTKFNNRFNVELSDEVLDDVFTTFSKIENLRAKEGTNAKQATQWAKEYVRLGRRLESEVNKGQTLGIMSSLKESGRKISDQETVTGKIGQTAKELVDIVTAPVYKSLKASLDASFALRQGFKVLTKSPKAYGENILRTFSVFKNIKSKQAMDAVMDEFKAQLISHPNYDKLVNEGKLAVGVVEDWFPTSIAEKVPALGNLFKGSNEAFTIFSQGARFDIANDMLEKATKLAGKELSTEEVKSIAQLANSITGRGSLGKSEAVSGFLNKLFFSARYIRSQADTFIMPFNPKLSKFAQQEARNHSLLTLSTIGSLMAAASAFGEVEWDPRSTKFGRVRIPGTNRWIDLTAGLGSYVTLAARQATKSTKNTKGKVVELNTGEYGSRTRTQVLFDWASNKLAPAPSVIKQVYGDGVLYGGKDVTAPGVANQLLAPISASNAYEYFTEEDLGTALLLSTSDLVGLGTK